MTPNDKISDFSSHPIRWPVMWMKNQVKQRKMFWSQKAMLRTLKQDLDVNKGGIVKLKRKKSGKA